MGIPTTNLDAGSVHLATADHENPVRPAGDGFIATLFQQHRLSQYRVRLIICYIIY